MAKEDYICEVKLKQITPMIHFQAEEPGACLRASEVKPKLDRFLIEQFRRQYPDRDFPKKWISHSDGEDDRRTALKYKMFFKACGTATERKVKPNNCHEKIKLHKSYFGNTISNNTENIDKIIKDIVYYKSEILMKIICFDKNLMEEIKDKIRAFFLLNNFGTRQHKGFGSFVVEDDSKPSDIDVLKEYIDNIFYIRYDHSGLEPFTVLDDIYYISLLMKSGYNGKPRNSDDKESEDFHKRKDYFKGFILGEWFWKNGIESINEINDKIFMKKMLTSRNSTELNDTPVYIRSMLGIQGVYRFFKGNIRGNIKVWDIERKIKRFNNPVMFKPTNGYLFIIPTEVPEKMLNHVFCFKPERDRYQQISTPKEFDLNAFLKAFSEYFNEKVKRNDRNSKPLGKARDKELCRMKKLTIQIAEKETK